MIRNVNCFARRVEIASSRPVAAVGCKGGRKTALVKSDICNVKFRLSVNDKLVVGFYVAFRNGNNNFIVANFKRNKLGRFSAFNRFAVYRNGTARGGWGNFQLVAEVVYGVAISVLVSARNKFGRKNFLGGESFGGHVVF